MKIKEKILTLQVNAILALFRVIETVRHATSFMTALGKNIGYLVIWGIVTLVSSYNDIVHEWSFDPVLHWTKDYNMAVVPLIVWMTAYFVDFLFTVFNKESVEIISNTAVKVGSFSLGAFFMCLVIVLAQTAYINTHSVASCIGQEGQVIEPFREMLRTGCLIAMFGFIMILKWGSLTSLQIKENLQRC